VGAPLAGRSAGRAPRDARPSRQRRFGSRREGAPPEDTTGCLRRPALPAGRVCPTGPLPKARPRPPAVWNRAPCGLQHEAVALAAPGRADTTLGDRRGEVCLFEPFLRYPRRPRAAPAGRQRERRAAAPRRWAAQAVQRRGRTAELAGRDVIPPAAARLASLGAPPGGGGAVGGTAQPQQGAASLLVGRVGLYSSAAAETHELGLGLRARSQRRSCTDCISEHVWRVSVTLDGIDTLNYGTRA